MEQCYPPHWWSDQMVSYRLGRCGLSSYYGSEWLPPLEPLTGHFSRPSWCWSWYLGCGPSDYDFQGSCFRKSQVIRIQTMCGICDSDCSWRPPTPRRDTGTFAASVISFLMAPLYPYEVSDNEGCRHGPWYRLLNSVCILLRVCSSLIFSHLSLVSHLS